MLTWEDEKHTGILIYAVRQLCIVWCTSTVHTVFARVLVYNHEMDDTRIVDATLPSQ